MNEHARTSEVAPRVAGPDRHRLVKWGLVFVLLLVGVRILAEVGMMREHGPDPQMSIWWMFLAIKAALWGIGGGVALSILIWLWRYRYRRLFGVGLLAAWALGIGWASWQQNAGRQALADARDVNTSPERLSELVHFQGIQAGYELDNRLAANPNTPAKALRELAAKPDQLGTQLMLARNPATPTDVREKLKVRE